MEEDKRDRKKYVWCEVINILNKVMKLLCKPEIMPMLGVGVVIVDGTMWEWAWIWLVMRELV